MFRTYKYRIYPTVLQQKQIDHHIGCCRLIYNLALETKQEAYKKGIVLSKNDLINQLVDLKKEFDWLNDVNAQSLQSSILHLDNAFKHFFRGKGFPKYKKKHNKQSFICPGNTRKIDFERGLLTISKIKDIPIVIDRQFKGMIKTVTIIKTSTDKYFANILVDTKLNVPIKPLIKEDTTLGIDLGLNHYMITDKGNKIDNPRHLKNALTRLKILQKRASRKKKGSNNRKKANKRVSLYHEKIRNQRNYFLHTLTKRLIDDNQVDTFVLEDLNVAGMIKNYKLAQSISDVGWSEFIKKLTYKCEWYGKNIIRIGRFEPSSKTCSCCGHKKKDLSLSERTFECEGCGVSLDRDINAAVNIKRFGLNKIDTGRRTSSEPEGVADISLDVEPGNTLSKIL